MVPETSSALLLHATPCTYLKGVGSKLANLLAKRDIYSLQDLLFHLPTRYQDRTAVKAIAQLQTGDHAVVEGVIQFVDVKAGFRKSLICQIHDGTGALQLRFFHFNYAQQQRLVKGQFIRCFGEVSGRFELSMIHPEYSLTLQDELGPREETLTPIYPTTEGLTQQRLRQLTDQVLALLSQQAVVTEYLEPEILKKYDDFTLAAALQFVHRPPPDACLNLLAAGQHPAQQRLALEELMSHHLSLRRLRYNTQTYPAACLNAPGKLRAQFLAQLAFQLTAAQQRVTQEILTDLEKNCPMQRLVQGDVGSGKTVVAALAALQAIDSGYQVALMAPTELLAEQHYQNFVRWLEPFGLKVSWLSGKLAAKQRRRTIEDMLLGLTHIVIGTHALFQKDVGFKQLGLIIVDEQHRFGVEQRLALREKGAEGDRYPHQLIMTATPIPRTLAMTAYADLDVSIIDELPPGRQAIKTVIIANTRREEVIERIRQACLEQRQVYWVCTLIEESETLQCEAAENTLQQLQQSLPELCIGLVHGRLSTTQRNECMQQFKAGHLDVLVATTVIEVGVDVPNASLMVIENPERLGLAQLHQLRGRVGRGAVASFCVLLYKAPLSEQSKHRLMILRDHQDGFEIARHDLEIRGPGEMLGTRQTGAWQLRIADLTRDQGLLTFAQTFAEQLLQQAPEKVEPLIERWLGTTEKYVNV